MKFTLQVEAVAVRPHPSKQK